MLIVIGLICVLGTIAVAIATTSHSETSIQWREPEFTVSHTA